MTLMRSVKSRCFCEGSRIYTMDSVCLYVTDAFTGQLTNMIALAQAVVRFPDIVAYLSREDSDCADELKTSFSKLNILHS